jgi:hypothetical protein
MAITTSPRSGKGSVRCEPSSWTWRISRKAPWIAPIAVGVVLYRWRSRTTIQAPRSPNVIGPSPCLVSKPASLRTAITCFANFSASSSKSFQSTIISPFGAETLLRYATIWECCSGVIVRGCRAAISRSNANFSSAVRSLAFAALSLARAVSAFAVAIPLARLFCFLFQSGGPFLQFTGSLSWHRLLRR